MGRSAYAGIRAAIADLCKAPHKRAFGAGEEMRKVDVVAIKAALRV